MTKKFVAFVGAALLLGLTVGVASGSPRVAGREAQTDCGTLYSPPCGSSSGTTTSITISSPTSSLTPSGPTTPITSCPKPGTILHFPITVHAPAGLLSVTVLIGKKKIKTIVYKGKPKTKRFSVTIRTSGDKPGLYTLTVKVRDVKGKTTSKHAQFLIC